MSKTKDLGHLASIVTYDASNNITLPAGLKINGSADVATQSYVGTQLGSYTPSTRSITINGTTYDLSSDRSWTITSMIYPAAGIALSTGSAWGTSITNNSTNWNTAYGWGNHASAGYLTGITSTQVTNALGFTPYNSTNPNGYITGITSGSVISALGYTPYNATNPSGYITSTGSITGSANSLNLSGHTISNSSWAGGSGYHGYTYNGGNYRFGFSSTSGVVDVYADGNFYATDSSYLVLHTGNISSYAASTSHQHDTLYYSGSARLWTGSDGTRNSGWAYHQDNGTGLHWPNNGWHIYPKNASDMYWRSGASDASIAFLRNGSQGNYVHNASDNAIGFLSSGRSWILRVTDGGDAYTSATHYAAGYRGSANVGGTGEATWHPAGIYCGSTMWAYGTTYRNGQTTSGQGWMYLDWNYGHSVVGVYTSVRYQGVWAMGDAYKLAADGTNTGNLYGLAWSHPNAGGQAGYLTNHGLIHMMYGTAFATISDNIWCRNNITAYSDIRVKENIEVIPNAMEKINAIRGVTFTRNDVPDTSKRHAGVIAQEVEKVLPEVITTNNSNGHLSVAYGNMVGLTIEGLKEHDVIINRQQETISLLIDQIEYLKQVINGIAK